MRKIAVALLGIALFALLLTGCGRAKAAKAVDAQIKAIGRVSVESGDALSAARAAYEALTDEEKEDVKKLKKLESAEETYENYTRINAEIAEMINLSGTEFSDGRMGISYLITRAEEIKAEYKKMSSYEKSQITGVDRIDEAVEKLKTYEANTAAPARAYLQAFTSLYGAKGYVVTAVYCIKTIRAGGEEFHYFALTAKDAAGEERAFYATARCTTSVDAETIAAHPDVFFADAPVNDASDAVKNGNITLDPAALTAE